MLRARESFVAALLALVVGGCEMTAPPACTPGGPGWITAAGTGLCLDGRPHRILGANRYDLLSSSRFRCGRQYDDEELDRLCGEAAGVGLSVLRTWAFSAFTDGGRDFSSLDRLIGVARQHDLRLILTLENEWSDCTEGDPSTADGRKGPGWFSSGWRDSLGVYLDVIVDRYRDEPQIAAWQLMNEAECTDASALRAFADEASRRIKAIDPRHLVSLGTIGTGQAGTAGEDYRRLHALPGVDLVEAHDYHEDRSALPEQIAADLAVARQLGKPMLIGEAGITAPTPEFAFSYPERARRFAEKLSAALAAGVAGYVLWSFYDLTTPTRGWDFSPDDPLAEVLRGVAGAL